MAVAMVCSETDGTGGHMAGGGVGTGTGAAAVARGMARPAYGHGCF